MFRYIPPKPGDTGFEIYLHRQTGTANWGVIARYYTQLEAVALPENLSRQVEDELEVGTDLDKVVKGIAFSPYRHRAAQGLTRKMEALFELLKPGMEARFTTGLIDSAKTVITDTLSPLDLFDLGFDDLQIDKGHLSQVVNLLQYDPAYRVTRQLALVTAAHGASVPARLSLDVEGHALEINDAVRPAFDWTLNWLIESNLNIAQCYRLLQQIGVVGSDPVMMSTERVGVIVNIIKPESVIVRFYNPFAQFEVSSEVLRYVASNGHHPQPSDAAPG